MTDPTAPADPGVDALAYDEAFAELQRTVAELESGGQPLEVMIARYERAVALQRRCERLLAEAELRVQQLMARPGGSVGLVDVVTDEPAEGQGSGPAGQGQRGIVLPSDIT